MKGKKGSPYVFLAAYETIYRNVVMFLIFNFFSKIHCISQQCKILHQKKPQGIHKP
jgi:hypothetical protein